MVDFGMVVCFALEVLVLGCGVCCLEEVGMVFDSLDGSNCCRLIPCDVGFRGCGRWTPMYSGVYCSCIDVKKREDVS